MATRVLSNREKTGAKWAVKKKMIPHKQKLRIQAEIFGIIQS